MDGNDLASVVFAEAFWMQRPGNSAAADGTSHLSYFHPRLKRNTSRECRPFLHTIRWVSESRGRGVHNVAVSCIDSLGILGADAVLGSLKEQDTRLLTVRLFRRSSVEDELSFLVDGLLDPASHLLLSHRICPQDRP